MTPLDWALYYASKGWRVAPVPPGSNHPSLVGWQNLATTDRQVIRRWWMPSSEQGICIVTGAESGIFAIDIDPRDGGDDSLRSLEAQYGPLPDTVEAVTPRGGRHILFRWPLEGDVRNSASGILGVGIDVRGTGGQINVAPTLHRKVNTPYEWNLELHPDDIAVADAPSWLLELIQKPPAAREPRRERSEAHGDMPGDIWAATTTWADELVRDGAQLHSTHTDASGRYYEMWVRPGKALRDGPSASLYYGGSNTLKVFSSNWPGLAPESTWELWGYHVQTKHGGDFPAAARTMRRTMNQAEPPQQHVGGSDKWRNEIPSNVTPTPLSCDASGFSTPNEASTAVARQIRPAIVHNGRQLSDVVDAAVAALVANNDPPLLFVRAGQLARLRSDEEERPLIEAMRPEHTKNALSDAADWYRALKDGERSSTTPPAEFAIAVLARGDWPLPPLAGVVELPVLRPDGSFHVEHGYDPATKLYHWHRAAPYEAIADRPTTDELAQAVALVDEMLCDFPWDTSADRANAWALLLTPLIRPLVGQVPMALVDAPEPGTGKGLLIKLAATITMGRAAGLMSWPTSEEELEKKITSALMAGSTMIIWDNVEGMIRSGTLAAVLTADTWQGRRLGVNEMVMVPNRATWACTGNNIDVGGDLARRCYRIRLDARQAQPWKRSGFVHADLEGWVAENRSHLLHALCTIVRAWWVDGRQLAAGISAMGGYTSWVRLVGGILEHAGVADFLGNLAEFHASADGDAQAWEGFLSVWLEEYGEKPMTVRTLISAMSDIYSGPKLRDVLPEDLVGHWDKPQFAKRLGNALKKKAGRHYGEDGLHIVSSRDEHLKVNVYTVTDRSMSLFDVEDHGNGAGLRGSAGFVEPLTREKTEKRTHEMAAQEPAEPRNPASRHISDDDELF